ncbi:glycoside hydrolase [Mytilinidion resinicola]|uniref:Glycoside hydrolase n=1 Tax=Mytilinidion resinicola TaxID=574789 RepID=A0A6A6Y544_9PEZI|nr:glycoside hydrolase [Mytilinidion resinicola]KAF2802907.1 glycoside hydrolase [Mytilinidion resinicola]
MAMSCGGSSGDQRTIGYYESWAMERSCDKWTPEDIDASLWTRINYAFALVGSDNCISSMNSYNADLYPRVTALKKMNSGLKVYIAVGGEAAGGAGFSCIVSSASSKATFIQLALAFISIYAFNSININ